MRLLALALFLCSCTYGLATDRMVRTGFHSKPIYDACMRKFDDDRRCLDEAGEVYSGDAAAVGGVMQGVAEGAEKSRPVTTDCTTYGNQTHCVSQ